MLVGYARVSTQEQSPELQLDALQKAGCERIFIEKLPGPSRIGRRSKLRSTTCGPAIPSWSGNA